MSISPMSVVKPLVWSSPFDDCVPLPSQVFPQQAIDPCTICAVSAMGWSTIMAPSKAQDSPPRERQTFVLSSVEQPFCVNLSIVLTIRCPVVSLIPGTLYSDENQFHPCHNEHNSK